MKNPFTKGAPKKPGHPLGLESIPPGAQMIPIELKRQFDTNPIHLFYPTPYSAITVLRNKKQPHDMLVCGWYLDTFRDHGVVKGLVYRSVASKEDMEYVNSELKKLDKDANVSFSP